MAGKTDIVIIGGGPAGYMAALRAAQLGASVTLVERGALGGTCLNRGCIPTTSLRESTAVLERCRGAAPFGVDVGSVAPNWREMVARKDRVVAMLVKGVDMLLRRANVRIFEGEGALLDRDLVEVRGPNGATQRVAATKILVATGTESGSSPKLRLDGDLVIDSTQALGLDSIPASLAIVGTGPRPLELATVYNAVGTRVTIVDPSRWIMPIRDKEITDLLIRELKKKGITVLTNTTVAGARQRDGEIALDLSSGETLAVAKVLDMTVRVPNTRGIGLEKVGVATRAHWIQVNERMETSVPGIYAVGDVAAGGWFMAGVAYRQGVVAAENMLGGSATMDYRVVPRTAASSPEIASVGLTEEEAIETGRAVKVGKFPFRALGRALAMGESEGLVKLVGDGDTDELLGAQIVGPGAMELIAEVAAAMNMDMGTTVSEIATTIHAHPTLPEALMEAAHVLEGQPLHI